MKSTQSLLFPGIAWWLLLLLPLVWIGFYPTYFSKPFSVSLILHLHTAALLAWVGLAIVQPILLLKKKVRLHRTLGKVSYAWMPLVFVTTWLVIRKTYFDLRGRQMTAGEDPVFGSAEEILYIPVIYLTWLAVFYGLAILKRKDALSHATYMFAAILTLLGPSLDRILFQVYSYYHIPFNFFAEFAVFGLIDLLLLGLLYYQQKKRHAIKAVCISLLLYLTGQAGLVFLSKTDLWKGFIRWIM
jgi:hypothetical protein